MKVRKIIELRVVHPGWIVVAVGNSLRIGSPEASTRRPLNHMRPANCWTDSHEKQPQLYKPEAASMKLVKPGAFVRSSPAMMVEMASE